MSRKEKQIEPFDTQRFFDENRDLCAKFMEKDTRQLDVGDIDMPQEFTYDRRLGIPSQRFDYEGLTLLQKLEYIKCKHDVVYFTEKYVTILSMEDGEIKFNLWDYQKELLQAFQDHRFVLSVQSRQSGKMIDVNTPIKTPNGYKKMGDIKEGMNVIGRDGKPTKVTFVSTQYSPEKQYQLTFSTNEDIKACGDHLWKVIVNNSEEKLCNTNQIHDYLKHDYFVSIDYKGRRIGIEKSEILEDKDKVVMQCIMVDNKDRMYLCGETDIPTHNTQTTAAYLTHRGNFNRGKKIAILANKLAQAKEIMARIQLTFERLPTFLKKPVKALNKTTLEFEDLTEIFCAASEGSGIRGKSVSELYWDEAAFTPNDTEFWESNFPVISSSSKSRVIVTSTPNGAKGVFFRLYKEGLEGTGSFHVVEVPYTRVPKYNNEEWKSLTVAAIGPESFEQEYNISFSAASGALINTATLQGLRTINPLNMKEEIANDEPILRIFEKSKPDRKYVITVDTARGLGLDYSAFVVFDVSKIPYRVVASYRNNDIAPTLYPLHIVNAAKHYNDAFLLIEINDLGESVANDIYEEFEYDNIFRVFNDKKTRQQKVGFFHDSKMGVKTSVATKKVGCAYIKSIVESGQIVVNDNCIVDELATFVRKNNSYEADTGCNDDMAMCMVMFGWLVSQQYVVDMIQSSFKNAQKIDYMSEHEEDLPAAFFVHHSWDHQDTGYITPESTAGDSFFNGFF